jgi:hypothetical protein
MGEVGFAERDVWNVGEREGHPGLMLAARIALPHFSVSSVMSLPKSAGEPLSTLPPKSASFALILGSERAALISLLSLSTISAGPSEMRDSRERGGARGETQELATGKFHGASSLKWR